MYRPGIPRLPSHFRLRNACRSLLACYAADFAVMPICGDVGLSMKKLNMMMIDDPDGTSDAMEHAGS